MINFQNEPLMTAYHHGSYIKLGADWRDKNVICPNSKLYYVIKGEISVKIEDEILLAKKGDAILIPAGIKHSYNLTDSAYAEKYWFHFDIRLGQVNLFDIIDIPYIKHIGINDALISLFDSIVNSSGNLPSDRLNLSSKIASLVSLYTDGCHYINEEPKEADETDRVITHIRRNYAEKFDIDTLASMAKLSPNYFTKKFKERVGHPPMKYVNILRIERAKFLLEHTDMPISAIMESVGFWDFAHFSKLFKSETGYSPTKFRKALAARNYK